VGRANDRHSSARSLTVNYSSPALGTPPLINGPRRISTSRRWQPLRTGEVRPACPLGSGGEAQAALTPSPAIPQHPGRISVRPSSRRGTTSAKEDLYRIITGFREGNKSPVASRGWGGAQRAPFDAFRILGGGGQGQDLTDRAKPTGQNAGGSLLAPPQAPRSPAGRPGCRAARSPPCPPASGIRSAAWHRAEEASLPLNGKLGDLGCEETLIYPFTRRSNE